MSANASEVTASTGAPKPAVPKRITNAQTVCNERNEKKKLCNGHLKQLRTAGEPAEVHLRGDDVLFKCQLCGTLYMGPPLGHVRDPDKQSRFVEAELTALLQAAGGTMPVIKKNEKGVYVIVEGGGEHSHAGAAKPAGPSVVVAKPSPEAMQAKAVATKAQAAPATASAGPKSAAEPNRSLFKRSTYAGVVDTGPIAGETREQKIERLKAVVAGAKQRAEEGGGDQAPATAAVTVVDSSAEADLHRPAAEAQAATGAASAAPLSKAAANASPVAGAETASDLAPDEVTPSTTPTPTTSQTAGEPDRTLFKRGTYAGFKDTGPVAGETKEEKIERLTKLAAAAKQRSEEGS
jgi:hypothetical protein